MFAKNIIYLRSAETPKHFPATPWPEIAFIGKSNVGKSSLINLLCGRLHLARTSKTPGATKKINFFKVDEKMILTDLPGYGYAKVSYTQREDWTKLVMNYLIHRDQIVLINLLIDARRGIKPNDLSLVQLLSMHNRPFQLVFTKSDKITAAIRAELITQTMSTLAEYHYTGPLIFTSSKNKDGAKELRHNLVQILDRSK